MTEQTSFKDSQPTWKEQVERAVLRAGKAFDQVVKDLERVEELTPEAVEKAFSHFAQLLELARQRAHVAACINNFSLDAEPPAYPQATASVMPPPRPERVFTPKAERIAGERGPVVAADPDDIDFIDE